MTALLTADETARLVPGEQLVIVRTGDPMLGAGMVLAMFVAPQAWVALSGPCPTCKGIGVMLEGDEVPEGDQDGIIECPDCLAFHPLKPIVMTPERIAAVDRLWADGRRIVPLYTADPAYYSPPNFNTLPVGRGSIEVVPVVDWKEAHNFRCIVVTPEGVNLMSADRHGYMVPHLCHLDPLPVPGRDWGIVIDCVEVA